MPKAQKKINTIQFNYFRNSELINVKYRGANKDFRLFKDGELIFYNVDIAINNEEVIIVEGEMDCLALYEAGYKNVISVPNGAGLGKINFDYLDNCIDLFSEDTKFILAVDNDVAGENLRDELARRLGYENCTKVVFKDCKDANDCLIKYGVQGIIDSIVDKTEFPIEGVFNANDIKADIYDFYNNGLPQGSNVGIYELDMHIKFQEGYITTITGIPGHGKSEFLDFILCKLNINHGWKTALYSPENHPLQLHFSKFAEKVIGKRFEGNNKMSSTELDAMIKYHSKNFFFVNPKEDFTIDNILATVKSLVRKKGIKAFVIDAWNKLDHHYTNNETKYISEQLDKLAIFCEKNKVHLFLVAHPTKISKDKSTGMYEVPNLYNISGSANFYNKTANGLTVYRNFDTGLTEIYIQKVKFKHWGSVGNVHLAWDKTNGRYYKGEPDSTNWLSDRDNNATQTKLEPSESFLTETSLLGIEEPKESPF
jgi:twinkle protein